MCNALSRLVLQIVFAFLSVVSAFGQTSTAGKSDGSNFVGAWIVSVEGEPRTRVLKIRSATQKAEGILTFDAIYGFTDENQSPVTAEVSQTPKGQNLVVVNRFGTRIDTIETSPGKYTGTFTLKNGSPKGVTISRVSEAEFQSAQKTAVLNAVPGIDAAATDVPKSCSLFPGAWTGTWRTTGRTWLWITAVDTNCVAKYSYGNASIPTAFRTTTIRNGVLTHTIPAGDLKFEIRGEEILGRFVGSSGDESSITYQKIQLSSDPTANLATLRAYQKEASEASVKVVTPGTDVPASCANFFGSWVGTWRDGAIEPQRLRVVEVDSRCIAKYSYANANMPTRILETSEIRGGVLSFVCNKSTGGTCNFRHAGDALNADYTNPGGGSNFGSFKKTQ